MVETAQTVSLGHWKVEDLRFESSRHPNVLIFPFFLTLGLRLDDTTLRIAVGLRLGTAVCSDTPTII